MNYEEAYKAYPGVEWLVNETKHEAHQKRYDAIVEKTHGPTALDIGAGVGNLAIKLQEKGILVTCVDVKEEYVEHMRRLGLHALKIDGTKLPFPDKLFDTVILSEIVEHMENPGLLLAEAFRVAKVQVIFTVPINCHDQPWHLWIVGVVKNGYGAIFNFEREEGM